MIRAMNRVLKAVFRWVIDGFFLDAIIGITVLTFVLVCAVSNGSVFMAGVATLTAGVVCYYAICAYLEYHERRLVQTLAACNCPQCQTLYGMELAQQVLDTDQGRQYRRVKKQPGQQYDFNLFWEVLCPQCGLVARYYYMDEKLKVAQQELSGRSA
jgi:hypothetical protein